MTGDGNNNNSDDVEGCTVVAVDARNASCFTQSAQGQQSLPENWLLGNSASTACIISNRKWLSNVRKAGHRMLVHSNDGSSYLNQIGDFGNFPEPVLCDPKGIANIMSLHTMSKYYRITMDTSVDNSLAVHLDNGDKIAFTPTGNGLY